VNLNQEEGEAIINFKLLIKNLNINVKQLILIDIFCLFKID